MSTCPRTVAAFLLVTCAMPAPVQAAPPPVADAAPAERDIASLFPAGTLAYAELADPAGFAPELAAVFKGTAFEDSIAFTHARKDAARNLIDLNGKKYLAALGLFASPEMLGELKKLRVAVGLIGFTANGEPEFVLVVLTHDSPAAGLAARAYLTLTTSLRKTGEVSKVSVFQHRTPSINYDNNGVPTIQNEKPPTDGPHEPTFAYTPGLFVLGSSKVAIGHAVRRFVGEEKAESLADGGHFKEAVAAHRKTGVFYHVNFPEFTAKFQAANRAAGGVRRIEDLLDVPGAANLDLLAWFNLTANAKAVRSISGLVRFRDGGLSATLSATFDPTQKSPLLDFLGGPGVKVELLHHARRPASFALAVTFPEKNRAAAVIGFLDAVAKANGELGRLPGEAVRELEQKFKVALAEKLIGKTRAVTVFLPTTQELPKGAKPMPLFVLHTEDGATAAAWEEFFPKLIGDISGAANPPQPASETVNGVKVFSLPGTGLPWNSAIHYARGGSVIAVGLDRKLVAQSVTADAVNAVVGGAKAVPPPPADAAAFGVVSLGEWVRGGFESPKPTGPVVPRQEAPLFLPNGNPLPEKFLDDLKAARKSFLDSLGTLPPATVTVRKAANELRLEVFQPRVQSGGLKGVIDAAAGWLDKAGGILGGSRNPGFDDFRGQRFGKW